MAYAVMIMGFLGFVLVQTLLANGQQEKLHRLYQIGAVQTLCRQYQWQMTFVLLQSVMLYGLMLACGLSLLHSLASLDGITGLGWGLFLAWLCVRYFHSAMVLKVVKNGALYL